MFKGKRCLSVTHRELKAAVIIYEMPVLRHTCYILFLPVGFSSSCGYSQEQWDIDHQFGHLTIYFQPTLLWVLRNIMHRYLYSILSTHQNS